MLFYILLLGAAPILGVFCISYVATYLCSILKAVLIGAAAIILIPRLLPAVPVIIVLAVRSTGGKADRRLRYAGGPQEIGGLRTGRPDANG